MSQNTVHGSDAPQPPEGPDRALGGRPWALNRRASVA
jgi:hypothetical protein